jgi:hypothetical protein
MFRVDDRAVSEQVGMIMLFGFLVVSMSAYQATVVPQENGAVEFRHGERVRADMVALSGAIDSAAVGQPRSARIELGTRYPRRTFFVNPPPATGTLRSEEAGEISVENAEVVGDEETAEFWEADDNTFRTDRLVYEPSYHAGSSEPTTTIEHGLVVTEYAGGEPVVDGEQTLVRGNEIRLVSISASVARSGAGTYSLSPDDVSAATRTIAITGEDGSPIVVELETSLTESAWESLLGDELDEESVSVDEGTDTLRLTLDGSATYRLRMANVSVGTSVETSGAYVTADRRTVPVSDARDEFTVEVYDRFNNPVPGVDVTASRSDVVVSSTAETGADGRATFRYEGSGGGHVAFAIGEFDPALEPHERVSLFLREAGSRTDAGNPDGGDRGGSAAAVTYDGNARPYWGSDGVQFSVTNDGGTTATVERVAVDSPSGADELKESNGGSGAGQHEMYVTSPSGDGRYEAGDRGFDAYALGETVRLSDPVDLAPGRSAELRLLRFRESGPGNSGSSVDMQGERLRVTLQFADGTVRTFEFAVGRY